MKNKHLYLKKAFCSALFVLLLSAVGITKLQAQNITFADANVKALCVANWDTDGDGELNQAEAVAVTSLDGVFMFDDEITSFDELSFFTGLTALGEDEFNSCTSLSAISIPNAVTSIGNYAFSDCSSLTSITSYAFVPPTLGNNVFDNVPSALAVNVPCGTSASYQAANGWSGLFNYEEFEYGLCPIVFADDNVKAICVAHWDTNGDGELSYAEAAAVTNLGTYFKSTSITSFEELEYFTSLTSLPNTAFYGCTSLTSIALPSSISALGNGSFYNCTSLATMTVYAETPPTVGTNAFKNVPTNMVVQVPCGAFGTYQNANDWNVFSLFDPCLITFADTNVKAICVANWDTNGDGELSYAEAAAVTYLGQVFRYNNTITSFNELQYFTGLTSIGDNTFYNCTSLTFVELPSSVTSIGYKTFESCSALISIEIPNSVTSIGTNPFEGCRSLEQIVVASDNAYYDSRENCNAIINTSTNALVTGCKNTVIPNSVTSIGGYAFYNCKDLTSIEIPNSVTSIGSSAFFNCNRLNSITVLAETPPSLYYQVNDYYYYSFAYVPKNIPVYVPCNAVEEYQATNGWSEFTNFIGLCSGEVSITVNPSEGGMVTGDGYYNSGEICVLTATPNEGFGFASWKEDGRVISMDSVCSFYAHPTTIVANFSSNSPIVFADSTVKALCVANWDTNGDGELSYVEAAKVRSLGEVFKSNSSITSFNELQYFINLTTINSYAFYSCTGLTSVTIGNSVNSIGESAFYNCNRLNIMTVLAETPPTLPNSYYYYPFSNVPNNIPVYVPCDAVEEYQTTSGWSSFTNILGLCSGEVSVTVNPSEGGTVTGAGYYSGGDVCVLTATPNQGYVFGNWMENGRVVSMDSVCSFYAHPTTIVANFCFNGQIVFADTTVKALCVANWDINGDGELSYVEAGVVTDLGEVFRNNNTITSFNELQYFTGLTSIGSYAFHYCTSLTSVEIPNSVTSIGSYAFINCTSLTSVEIPNTVTSIGSSAFSKCTSLTSVEIPNSMTSISDNTFYNCTSLTSIDIPNSVTTLGNSVFYSCTGLTSVSIGNSLTTLGSNPFGLCPSLEQIIVASDNQVYDSRNNCNAIIQTSTNELVVGCKNTVIPNSVTSIGGYAFYNCTNLTSVELPNSIISIGSSAFSNCTSLTFVEIPNSVTSIGSSAFSSCNGLNYLTLGNSVTSIGNSAFSNCNILTIKNLAENPPTLGSGCFGSLNSNIVVFVPCGFEDAYTSLSWGGFCNFYGMCDGTVTVTANPEEGGTVIGGGTFEGGQTSTVMATALENYHFAKWTLNGMIVSYNAEYSFNVAGDMTLVAHFVPDDNIIFADSIVKSICVSHWDTNGDGELSYSEAASVLSLNGYFNSNSEITSFDELQYFIGLTSIQGSSFIHCSALTSISLPNSVASIKNNAFYECTGLTSLTLGNSVNSIGESAFKNCSGLTSLTLGNSVTFIGHSAFYDCTSLTGSLILPNTITSIGSYAFRNCSGFTGDLTIPNSVTAIGFNAFQNCSGLTSLTIGNSVLSIGSNAFRGCSSLTSLTIGSSVTSIGNYAFQSSTGLGYLHVLAETPPSLGENVFGYSFPNIPVYVPCGTVEDYQAATDWSRFTNIIGTCSGEVSVTVNPLEGGMVTGAGYYTGGELCVLTATPNEGFAFVNWKENGRIASTDSVYTFPAHPATIVANFCSNSPIAFADTIVKALCVANWDTNGDGELSYAEAAAVTDLGQVFQYKSTITSFDELQYFINLTSIGSSAFYDCTSLTSLEIPNSVTSIGSSAFYNCTSLTSVEIPNSVTSIGGYAFINCINLEQIVVASGNTIYDSRGNCNAIIETATNTLLLGCKNTVIPYSVTEIGDSAFEGCTGLTTIVLPSSVTSINDGAFYGCSGLTAVYYTGDVSQWCNIQFADFWVDWWDDFFEREGGWIGAGIGESNPLFHAHNLYIDNELVTDLVIPETVTEIKPWTFIDATCLTSLTIGSSVTNIGDGAFYGCNGLTSIEIPNSVTSIGNSAFSGCSGLTSMIVLADNPPTLGSYAFYNVNKGIPVYVPCGRATVYQSAAGWNEFTNIQELCTQTQTITLSQGWNWFSTNVEITLDDLKTALLEALPGTNITIKSKDNGQITYNGTTWRGQLATLDVAQMYRISVSAVCEITLEGTLLNPAEHPVTISNGDNWIGFPLNESVSLSNTFNGFAVSGDVIKSKDNGIATYNGTQWRGTLNTLVPGQGYIYKSAATGTRTFTFPTSTK